MLVAVVDVATKYGAVMLVPEEIAPTTARAPVMFVAPAVRVVNVPVVAETEIPLESVPESNVPPRKSPFLTIKLERS